MKLAKYRVISLKCFILNSKVTTFGISVKYVAQFCF